MINYSLNNFINFMTYIKYAQAIPSALNYKVDPFGNVYNSQGIKIKPSNYYIFFHSLIISYLYPL